MCSTRPASFTRQFIADILGVGTVFCTSLWLLTLGFIEAQCMAQVYEGPILGVAICVLTFPPALIFTSIALLLVGRQRCKLAWISLLVFVVPVGFTGNVVFAFTILQMIERHW